MIHLVDGDTALSDGRDRACKIVDRDREMRSPNRPVVLDQMNLLPTGVEPRTRNRSRIRSRDLHHAEYVSIEDGCLGGVSHPQRDVLNTPLGHHEKAIWGRGEPSEECCARAALNRPRTPGREA